MGAELTVLNTQPGGLGISNDSKFLNVKPANLSVVQPNSQVEGAIAGRLRINETGDQLEEITAALLFEPTEQRQYHIGEPGELNRTPENLLCFSTDLVVPHTKAKIPQAMNCASCPKADWGPWREYKEKNNGKTNKNLIPRCDQFYKILLIDTTYNLPLQMFIRSKAKEHFEQGMANVARIILMEKAKGHNPNIFDVKFKIRTKKIQTGQYSSYVPIFLEPKLITDQERTNFGAVYLQYINQQTKSAQKQLEADAQNEIESSQNSVDNQVVESDYVDKEIII